MCTDDIDLSELPTVVCRRQYIRVYCIVRPLQQILFRDLAAINYLPLKKEGKVPVSPCHREHEKIFLKAKF